MKLKTRSSRPRRQGFTLIEVLVVIAIISLLVGLILAGVMAFMGKGPETVTRADITNMDSALQSLKSQYNVKYLPSRLKLSPSNNYYSAASNYTQPNTPIDVTSVAFLSTMFGRRLNLKYAPGTVVNNWSGTGSLNDMTLEGEECLMFYLGGIPQVGNGGIMMTGFNSDRANPTAAGGTRESTAFPFKSNRISTGPSGFPVYLDAWGTAYAYFSSGPAGNDYNSSSSDCPTLTGGTLPYFSQAGPPIQFLNPNSFQIISAGPNKKFAPGGLWNPTTGGPVGSDDMSNFSKTMLGRPQG